MASYQYIYVMKGLSKTFPGGRQVLSDIWLSFFPGAKIGVLGLNGAGKSTLLRIMAGLEEEFAGEAWAAEGARVGFLPQEPELDPEKDVAGNVLEGLAETKALVDRFEEVSLRFGEELSSDAIPPPSDATVKCDCPGAGGGIAVKTPWSCGGSDRSRAVAGPGWPRCGFGSG
jgi:ATPase subunit of ABC transporter with duplicated ATPase domains